jgi:cell wall-associated NlpC family hydrolase
MSEIDSFIEFVLSKEGCDYVWPDKTNNYSGKDLTNAQFKNVYDCSGLVTSGLYHATKGRIDWRSTKNAQALFDSCKDLDKPGQTPSLAFYGHGKNMIEHVVIVLKDGSTIGANGGGSWCVTPEKARERAARVRRYPSPEYRKDLKGLKQIPL